jgi:hypothetical protein
VLYRVIDQHLPPFREQAREHGGVPGFVEDAFRDFLISGVLAHGLCRFRCSACRCERLVALSCKGRGLCPSCGAKGMTDLAAHIVEHVIPRVPVRQWVLTLPHAFRYRLAYDHPRMIAVFGVFVRAVLGFYARKARALGLGAGQTRERSRSCSALAPRRHCRRASTALTCTRALRSRQRRREA